MFPFHVRLLCGGETGVEKVDVVIVRLRWQIGGGGTHMTSMCACVCVVQFFTGVPFALVKCYELGLKANGQTRAQTHYLNICKLCCWATQKRCRQSSSTDKADCIRRMLFRLNEKIHNKKRLTLDWTLWRRQGIIIDDGQQRTGPGGRVSLLLSWNVNKQNATRSWL